MVSAINQSIGNQLKRRRKELGLSQTDLGQLVNISYQQIQKYESGTSKIPPERLYIFSVHLNVTVSYFFEKIAGE